MTHLTDPSREAEHLALADRHITEGEVRIAEQRLRIATLKDGGHDTTDAETLLRSLLETLVEFREHRELIVQAMDRHEAE